MSHARRGIRMSCFKRLIDEVGQGECDAQFEGALVHRSTQDLLGLPEPVGDGVLVDVESFGGSGAASVLVEVGAHGGGESPGGVIAGRQCAQLAGDEGAGLVDVRGGECAQRDVAVAGDAAFAATGHPRDPLRLECLEMAGAKSRDAAGGVADRNRSSASTLDGTSPLVLIQAATDNVPRGWTSGCWLPIAAAMSRMAASSRASVLRPSSWVSSQAIAATCTRCSSWRSRRLATSVSIGCPARMAPIVSAWLAAALRSQRSRSVVYASSRRQSAAST